MAGGDSEGHESGGAILAAFLANLGIAAAKFVGFLLTGSSSLLAESIHSVADSSNQGLLFLGGKQAKEAPDELHQFGHGRVRYFWAFVVAIVLFTVGGAFSLYEGWHKVHEPEEVESPGIAIGILVIALGLEGNALRTAARHARPQKGDRSWPQFIQQTRQPELPALLLEDSAAIVGLALALVGVVLAVVLDAPVWDGIGTLGIGVLLLAVAFVLAREMRSLLIGEAAAPELQRRIEGELGGAPEVVRVIHVLTQHLGPDELLVAAKVQFDPGLTTEDLVAAIDAAERRVRGIEGAGRCRIYIEPDVGARESVVEAAKLPDAG